MTINVRMGVCDAIFAREGFPRITTDGKTIHIVVYGQHWPPGELCTFPTGTASLSLGNYLHGNYVVNFEMFYLDFLGEPKYLSLGTVPFTVKGDAQVPSAVPSLSAIGLMIMALLLFAAVFRNRAAHRYDAPMIALVIG